jgi:hypothetical protein
MRLAVHNASNPPPMTPKSDIPPTDPPDIVPDHEPDVLATPEGDAEYPGDQPLQPGDVPPIERPRGNEPHYNLPLRKALD